MRLARHSRNASACPSAIAAPDVTTACHAVSKASPRTRVASVSKAASAEAKPAGNEMIDMDKPSCSISGTSTRQRHRLGLDGVARTAHECAKFAAVNRRVRLDAEQAHLGAASIAAVAGSDFPQFDCALSHASTIDPREILSINTSGHLSCTLKLHQIHFVSTRQLLLFLPYYRPASLPLDEISGRERCR